MRSRPILAVRGCALHLSNLTLRSWLQERIGNAFDLFDLGAFHPVREVERRALAETVDYIGTSMREAIGYYSGRRVLEHALRLVPPIGHLMEFGVYRGSSINLIGRLNPKRTVHGFDSFHGLPDDWRGWRDTAGSYSLRGHPPRTRRNVKLHPGLFADVLPDWLRENPGEIAFAHIDCDLYQSAKTVLDLIAGRLTAGTVIVFDEYFNFPFWRDHEFRAFQELVVSRSLRYRYLAYARAQVAVAIKQ
jgi:hypothetical protein